MRTGENIGDPLGNLLRIFLFLLLIFLVGSLPQPFGTLAVIAVVGICGGKAIKGDSSE